jgi:release factor glutamine methyltransferase
MRNAIKYFVGATYKPLVVKYLSKTKNYQYDGIKLIIPPEVFHPRFFFSTKLLLKYLDRYPLKEKTFLELGAGSGLIAISAAKKGADVTATDINPIAVQYLKKNCGANNVCMNIIHSDLFQNISVQYFDFIAINPPYYKKQPHSYKDYSWYCGENGEYFQGLFYSIADYMHSDSVVLMILSEGCDVEMIQAIAGKNRFHLHLVCSKQNLLEKNFIFQIKASNTNFEERYMALRRREKRVYSDAEVAQLPNIDVQHQHYKEWMIRKASAKKLIDFLKRKKLQPLKILEIGCGNGWLSNQLSGIENSDITGLDINEEELQQAERVFKNNRQLKFVYGEIYSGMLANCKFDVIIFAASIQYFKSLKEIINAALERLAEAGEIHIIDSPFYPKEEVMAAKKRSKDYYTMLGFSEMAEYYFHHNIEELEPYNFRVLDKPSLIKSKLFRNNNPFPWLCIKRNYLL